MDTNEIDSCCRGIRGYGGDGNRVAIKVCVNPGDTIEWEHLKEESYNSAKYFLSLSLPEESKFLMNEVTIVRHNEEFVGHITNFMGDYIDFDLNFQMKDGYITHTVTNNESTILVFGQVLMEYIERLFSYQEVCDD